MRESPRTIRARTAIARCALVVAAIALGSACAASTPTPDATCHADATSPTVPGVTITVDGERCTFDVGQGGRFTYAIDVKESVPYQAQADVGCGSCSGYGSDPLALTSATVGTPSTAYYCVCDVGCCAPSPGGSFALAPGHYAGTLDWPGRQWLGPSDTGNPLGDPFPKGTYDVHVTLSVPNVGHVEASLPIEVR